MKWLNYLKTWGDSPPPAADTPPLPPLDYPPRPLIYPPEVLNLPVLVVRYFPVKNGRIDRAITGDVDAPLEQIRQHTETTTQRVGQALETGSIYHGYKEPSAQPSLRYHRLETVDFLEPLPT